MSKTFDPYHRWLGIAPEEQPANFYRLLGLRLLEDDADVIESAADRQMTHVRSFQGGQYVADSQRILNELTQAKLTLLTPEKKAAYDAGLSARSANAPSNSPGHGSDNSIPVLIDVEDDFPLTISTDLPEVAEDVPPPPAPKADPPAPPSPFIQTTSHSKPRGTDSSLSNPRMLLVAAGGGIATFVLVLVVLILWQPLNSPTSATKPSGSEASGDKNSDKKSETLNLSLVKGENTVVVPETTEPFTVIHQFAVENPSADVKLNYQIVSGNESGTFYLEADSGELMVAKMPREMPQEIATGPHVINVRVKVTGKGPHTVQGTSGWLRVEFPQSVTIAGTTPDPTGESENPFETAPIVEPPIPPAIDTNTDTDIPSTISRKELPPDSIQDAIYRNLVIRFDLKKVISAEQALQRGHTLLEYANAKKQRNSPAEYFVGVNVARGYFARAGRMDLAFAAIDKMAAEYAVYVDHARLLSFQEAFRTPWPASEKGLVLEPGIAETERFMAADLCDYAVQMVDPLIEIAKLTKDDIALAKLMALKVRLDEYVSRKAEFDAALATFKNASPTPDAYLEVGRHYLFVRHNWSQALAHLVKAGDDPLALVAADDMAYPTDPAKQVKVADSWYDLAQEEENTTHRDLMLGRALGWYTMVSRNNSGELAADVSAHYRTRISSLQSKGITPVRIGKVVILPTDN